MKVLLILASFLASSAVLAHPNGTYQIDGESDVTVTFMVQQRCPTDIDDAMRGSLRTLSFSEAATYAPYDFIDGYYVETHNNSGEVYVQTDESCVAIDGGEEISASRSSFAGFSLRRLSN